MNVQQMEEREQLAHDARVEGFRQAIIEIRLVGLRLIDLELFGASDVVGHCVFALERQIAVFSATDEGQRATTGESQPATPDEESAKPRSLSLLAASRRSMLESPSRKGRRIGVDVIPGSVKRAREEAGLTLSEVAGKEVTRVAIWYIETNRVRPSLETLQLIAKRTGKDLSYFLADTTRVFA